MPVERELATHPDDYAAGSRAPLHVLWQVATLSRAGRSRTYQVAGEWLVSPRPLPDLEPFAVATATDLADHAEPPLISSANTAHVCHDGTALLGGRRVRIASCAGPAGYRIEVEGLRPFLVSSDGCLIVCGDEPGSHQAQLFAEALLGPVLILALALRGTFCLHASAVSAGDRVVAFTGESGAGKSTLARELERTSAGRWRRLADDILPVVATPDGVRVEPHFPQLKLPPEEQLSPAARERFTLSAIYALEPKPPEPVPMVSTERLAGAAAIAAVVGGTVAARLFGRELLASHLEFCSTAAAHVPVRCLRFSRTLSTVPRIRDLLASEGVQRTANRGGQP